MRSSLGPHAAALGLLRSWAPPTPAQQALRDSYVGHLAQHPDGLLRTCSPDHLTASTLVMDPEGELVLLTLHAKAGRWFQFGGHIEAQDASLASAAARELSEESGLADLVIDPVPVQLSQHRVPFCGSGGATRHLDVRFLAIAEPDGRHAASEESLDVAWWPADALPDPDPDLVELVVLARSRQALGRLNPGTG